MMLPPTMSATRSAPSSNIGSPNISPPNSFATQATYQSNTGHGKSEDRSSAMDINMLANAASQVERENVPSGLPSMPMYQHQHHLFSHRNPGQSTGRLPSLSAYAISMSRSQSQEAHMEDHEHRIKRSRPGSPVHSTNPSSPSFSTDSISPTPAHTPLATPAHSPRLVPHTSDVHLPGLRNLSIGHGPLLAPMEPSADGHHSHYQQSHPHAGPTIADIMSRQDGTQRKLPVPQLPTVALQEINGHSGNHPPNIPSLNADAMDERR